MDERKRCGPLVELVKTPSVRVQRCACGTIHLATLKNGVTMQLSEEEFRAVARGMAAAEAELEPQHAPPALPRTTEPIN